MVALGTASPTQSIRYSATVTDHLNGRWRRYFSNFIRLLRRLRLRYAYRKNQQRRDDQLAVPPPVSFESSLFVTMLIFFSLRMRRFLLAAT